MAFDHDEPQLPLVPQLFTRGPAVARCFLHQLSQADDGPAVAKVAPHRGAELSLCCGHEGSMVKHHHAWLSDFMVL